MDVTINLKLSKTKDSSYTFNIDMNPGKLEIPVKRSSNVTAKTPLGAIQRPSADRLKILKNPELKAEEKATEEVMDKIELE